jgi:hypothetical protein
MLKRIGIITWHYYSNFGSQLQAYALVKTIRELGFQCKVINYHSIKFGKPSKIKAFAERIIPLIPERICRAISSQLVFPSVRFRSFFDQTSHAYTDEQLKCLSKDFDAIVCGSDQIWAPNVYNPVYMLTFVPDGVRKISYAASIGLNDIPNELVDAYRSNLQRLDFISVRENKGRDLLLKKCNIEAEVVLDPTLLLTGEQWKSIVKKPKIDGRYLFCYFLREDHNYETIVKEYAEKHNLKIYAVSAKSEDASWLTLLNYRDTGPKEFLGLILHAETVVTDSYHGSIFALQFHKNLYTFQRFASSEVLCQNSRIDQLKSNFLIDSRIINTYEVPRLPELPSMDWTAFETHCSALRERSLQYIIKSLA